MVGNFQGEKTNNFLLKFNLSLNFLFRIYYEEPKAYENLENKQKTYQIVVYFLWSV